MGKQSELISYITSLTEAQAAELVEVLSNLQQLADSPHSAEILRSRGNEQGG